MLNKIIIMGRLTRDPELRRTGSGTAVTSFSLAVDRDFKSQSGEKETDFIDVVAWRSTAEFVSKYFTKGRMAVVRVGCRSAIGRTRTAASAEAPRSSPTMSTSGIPNGTAPAISAAHPLLTAPPWAAATPHRWADNPISPRSAKRTANCRSDF